VAPEDDTTLGAGGIARVDERGIVRIRLVDEEAAADRLHHLLDVDEHDVSQADVPGLVVVATLLADVDDVVPGPRPDDGRSGRCLKRRLGPGA
jgi:hypothetical protein